MSADGHMIEALQVTLMGPACGNSQLDTHPCTLNVQQHIFKEAFLGPGLALPHLPPTPAVWFLHPWHLPFLHLWSTAIHL